MIQLYIGHMCSGKSTFQRRKPLTRFDIDSVRTPDLDRRLKPLRQANKWPEHNAIWHSAIRDWASFCQDNVSVAVHSIQDATALREGLRFTSRLSFVILEDALFLERCRLRHLTDEELRLANLNRDGNHAAASENPIIPVLSDWPA